MTKTLEFDIIFLIEQLSSISPDWIYAAFLFAQIRGYGSFPEIKRLRIKPFLGKKEIYMNKTNKMGLEPVKSLMLKMGLPMIISMALQAFYNIVDSYFVSCMHDTADIQNMGDYGVNALTLAFPIQMLMVAIGVGTGVGLNALLSKSLGEKKRTEASRIAGNSIFLGLCTFAVFFIFGIFGVNAYMRSQTSDPIIYKMGGTYLRICTVFSIGITMYTTYEKLLQATGRTMLSTIAQISGAVSNIILDPIMIFGLLGCPEMGIAGAAYATVIGQCISFILDSVFHYKYNKQDLDTNFSYIKPDIKIIKKIYQVGIPAIIMQALMSVMTYGINIIFGSVSAAAVTAYGMYYKIQQFVFFAAFGMNNAMIPIIGFNFGMRDKNRVIEGIRYGILYTLIIMFIGGFGLQIFAKQICSCFAVSSETQNLCILAIRIITIGYLFVGTNIACQGIFQALGHGIASLILSMLRLIVIVFPLAWIFTLSSNAQQIIWSVFPAAEAAAFIYSFLFLKHIKKHDLRSL